MFGFSGLKAAVCRITESLTTFAVTIDELHDEVRTDLARVRQRAGVLGVDGRGNASETDDATPEAATNGHTETPRRTNTRRTTTAK